MTLVLARVTSEGNVRFGLYRAHCALLDCPLRLPDCGDPDALDAQMPSMDGIGGDQVDQTVKFCDAAAMEDYFFQTRRTPSSFACDENSYRETVR